MKLLHLMESVSTKDGVAFLQEHCGPALKMIAETKNLFYRGTFSHIDWTEHSVASRPEIFISSPIPVNKDRVPRDTPEFAHRAMDKWFKKTLGFKARSQGLFVTMDKDQAGGYGDKYFVLPVGEFTAYWSPEIRDLTVSLYPESLINKDMSEVPGPMYHWFDLGYEAREQVPRREQIDYIEKQLNDANYKKNHLDELTTKVGEVMIDVDEYILVPISPSNRRTLEMIASGEIFGQENPNDHL